MVTLIFISYRHSDEPFTVALLGVLLTEHFGQHAVYLDTVANRRARRVEASLGSALEGTSLMLCIIGPHWDGAPMRQRLWEDNDLVRLEVGDALSRKVPLVPVLVDRDAELSHELPSGLLAVRTITGSPLRRASFTDDAAALVRRVEATLQGRPDGDGPAVSHARGTTVTRELRTRAVDVMLRHVLPLPQHAMGHLGNVVCAVVSLMGSDEWLEYLVTGHLPRRRWGSALVVLTDTALRVAEFDTNLRVGAPQTIARHDVLRADLRPTRRLWQEMATLTIEATGGRRVVIEGVIREPAQRLVEILARR